MTMRFNGLKNWPWWGENLENLVYTLYVRDDNKEKRSQKIQSIRGVLPCSILRIWRLWARTKHEYTMDNFSTLSFQEPWLLKKISTFPASTWLVERNLMLQGRRDLRRETKSTRISKRPLRKKGRLVKEFQNFLLRKMNSCGNFRTILLTPLLNLRIWGVDISLF
jgi:hypothetical protein